MKWVQFHGGIVYHQLKDGSESFITTQCGIRKPVHRVQSTTTMNPMPGKGCYNCHRRNPVKSNESPESNS